VGDHQDRHPSAPAKAVQQRQDAGPDGDVEHRHGLVGHQEVQLEREGCRDGDPLALAARQLVGVALLEQLRRGQLGTGQRVAHAPAALLARLAHAVDEQRLLHPLPGRSSVPQ